MEFTVCITGTTRLTLTLTLTLCVFGSIWGRPWGNRTFYSCSWAPDGKLLWAEDENLYYAKADDLVVTDDSIVLTDSYNLTSDVGPVLNGIADWVYEEEILSNTKAYYWSDNGDYLAYIRFDDSKVNSFPIIQQNYEISFPNFNDLVVNIPYPRYLFE